MNKRNLFLRYFGILTFVVGAIFHVLMIVNKTWPTYLFLIICLIGLLQFGFSFNRRKIKILWQIFFAVIPFFLGYLYIELNSASKDIILIPDNYRGQVNIQFGNPNGAEKERDGFWRVYRIPANGNLKTKYKLKGESIDIGNTKYLYVDKNGRKKKLNVYCENCESKDTTSIQIISIRLSGEEDKDQISFIVDIPNSKYFKNQILNGS